jgi:hypothetical protein
MLLRQLILTAAKIQSMNVSKYIFTIRDYKVRAKAVLGFAYEWQVGQKTEI